MAHDEPSPRELMEFAKELMANGLHVHVHHHHHYPAVMSPTPGERIIMAMLQQMDQTLMSEIDDLTAAVERTEAGEASAITLMNGLSQQLHDLSGQPHINPADVAALAARLDAKSSDLAAAITADGDQPASPPATPASNVVDNPGDA